MIPLRISKPKHNKYNVAPPEQRTVDGIVFASAAEAKRFCELKLLEKGGFIRDLELQPVYPIFINGKSICKVILDFRYWEGCTRVVEDTKGFDNPVSKLKRRLVEAMYPGVKIMVLAA